MIRDLPYGLDLDPHNNKCGVELYNPYLMVYVKLLFTLPSTPVILHPIIESFFVIWSIIKDYLMPSLV